MTIYIPTGRGINVLYDDNVDLDGVLPDAYKTELVRNSHVEPMPGNGIRFEILWHEPFKAKFGTHTICDERGQPFTTRKAAVACEVRMILRDFYGIPWDEERDEPERKANQRRRKIEEGRRESRGSQEAGSLQAQSDNPGKAAALQEHQSYR